MPQLSLFDVPSLPGYALREGGRRSEISLFTNAPLRAFVIAPVRTTVPRHLRRRTPDQEWYACLGVPDDHPWLPLGETHRARPSEGWKWAD